jgi:phosphoglycerate dehydrogenase-like enzyme
MRILLVGLMNILNLNLNKMKIWKNTSTLDGFDNNLNFTELASEAEIALLGGKSINLNSLPNLKGIFRAGVGADNIPIIEAKEKGVIVRFPSKRTMNIIYEETASFTCSLIFRMLFNNLGTIEPWLKNPRDQLSKKKLLVIGKGRIGTRVLKLMSPFIQVFDFDILDDKISKLKKIMKEVDCVTLHIPKTISNVSFIDEEKLSWMRNDSILVNTSRGAIVDEEALYKEIKQERLKAAFDVFWEEPYHGKLADFHPNSFFMTPHVASTCSDFLLGCRKDLNLLIKEIELSKY